ncbi:chromosome partitioning protein [Pseudoclavibacter sp. RFBJ3]|uniref:MinD/ParA family ATP-binding protein n=1 Tax=unclassified Pseudoclavibacter TaxID=2615177 RepID=UPI000CE92952|nr:MULTISPECIES: chromosome partitioning protein [unclassified Pseudoclavibacter]PPF83922.1 chromosome partitioning protein [Pseudoclavibacter sp. RFBJ5]PPF92202.1 chromosome partitioning protein [Pseudoclavibacter sp. RFBJ3]PPF97065.1 chromosome partitioning protein [Pseudoclavibacter sp. RFBH5]PPG23752.1 chromosome partitioning protein [Pseudoclavibacter sp. RFBI4]
MTNAEPDILALEVLIRRDGVGEIREGDSVERIIAADADELRSAIMTRVVDRATRDEIVIDLRTIDIDGVFPLRVSPDGGLVETGDVAELAPGEDELTDRLAPGATAPEPSGDPATQDRHDETSAANSDGFLPQGNVHETVRIPRVEMMHHALDQEAEVAQPAPVLEAGLPETGRAPESPDQHEDEAGSPTNAETPPVWFEDRIDEDGLEDTQPWQPRFPRDARQMRELEELERAESAARELARPSTAPEPANPAPVAASATAGAVARAASATAPERRKSDTSAPTLADLLADKQAAPEAPAQQGWRSALRLGTGGLIKLGPGEAERVKRDEIRRVQRQFDGSRTVVVMNPKGGAHKTTATLMIAATFGEIRGGYTLAWDNNETRGTLGWRSHAGSHRNTAVDFLRQLPRFEVSGGATIADVDRFVRPQGDAQFDVLASDDDAASAAIIDAEAFSRMHRTLSRFYRVLVVDTGNNMRASNWEAALDVADQLVIVSTAREDTAASAAWLADGLRERGFGEKLENAVTILSSPSAKEDQALKERLHHHFERLTRAVVEVPYDHAFVGGGELSVSSLKPATRDAWRTATAAIAERL